MVFFSSVHELEEGYYQEGDYIVRRLDGEKEVILNVHTDMNLVDAVRGKCDGGACHGGRYGRTPRGVQKGYQRIPGGKHRIEYVAEKNGVIYYNDSKGTNPDAAIQGIRAMSRPPC